MTEPQIDTDALADMLAALKARAGLSPEQEARIRQALVDPAAAEQAIGDLHLRQAIWRRLSGQAAGNRRQRRAARKRR